MSYSEKSAHGNKQLITVCRLLYLTGEVAGHLRGGYGPEGAQGEGLHELCCGIQVAVGGK